MSERFEPRKRTALDGRIWWCIYDMAERKWSTFLCHGKYRTRAQAELAITFSLTKIQPEGAMAI